MNDYLYILLCRIHGLKSGTTIKEFRGHKSFVNAVLYNYKGNRIVTGGSDGYIKVWDSNTAQCITTFAPPDYSTDNELISSDAKTVLKAISSLFFTRNVCNSCDLGIIVGYMWAESRLPDGPEWKFS